MRNQLRCVILMLKHEKFSQRLNEVLRPEMSMSSRQITLSLSVSKKRFAFIYDSYAHIRRGECLRGLPRYGYITPLTVDTVCIF